MVFGVAVPFYDPGGYWLTRFALQRGLAVIYLFAFVVALRQFRPLCGEDGLMPIDDYVDRWTFRDRPSLLYHSPTDETAAWMARVGVTLSALAVLGVPSLLGTPFQVAVWLAMWALYLSFANAGQLFYGYGWESMLCEAGALAVFLGGWERRPPSSSGSSDGSSSGTCSAPASSRSVATTAGANSPASTITTRPSRCRTH